MNAIVTQMVILFIIVIIGYFLSKKKMMDADFDRKLSVLVINVTCPSLILSSVMGDTLPDKSFILPLLIVGFATYIVLIGGAFLLPRLLPVKAADRGIYSFMLAFGNVGFIGYPIVASIFGANAVFYACILNFPSTLLIFVFGTLFVSGGEGKVRFDWRTLYCPAGRRRQGTLRLAHTLLSGDDCVLPFHSDCSDRLDTPQSAQHAFRPLGKHHRARRPAHRRLFHCPGPYLAHVQQYGYLPHVCPPPDAGSPPDIIPLAPVPGRGNHRQHQRGIGSNARSFLRHSVLHPVWERGSHHGGRNLHHHLAFGYNHPAPDNVLMNIHAKKGAVPTFRETAPSIRNKS